MSDTPEPGPSMDRQELQARAVKGALWTGIHTVISMPLAFVVNILLARVLGVADYGRLAYLTTVVTIASVIASLGVTTALIQFGSKAHAQGDTRRVRHLLSASQGFRLMVSGPIIALTVVALVRVDWWLLALALVFGVAAPALLGNARPALTIENRTDRAAQLTMIGNIVMQAIVVMAVLLIGTPDAVWSARVIATGLLLALPLVAISPLYRSAVIRPSAPWRLPRSFWRFAVPTGVAAIIATLVTDRTGVIFLEWLADGRAMGLFGLAFGVAGHVYAPAQAFLGPLVPAVSGLAEVDSSSLQRAFHRTTRAAGAIGGLLVAAVLPTLACLLPVIYGREFADASDLLVILGIGSAVLLIGAPHQAFLMARLGGRRLLWINIVSLITNLALMLLLIPPAGALGAAIACSTTFVLRALHLTLGEARALMITARSLLSSLGAMLLSIGIATGLWVLAREAQMAEVPLAMMLALAGVVLYTLGLRIFRVGVSRPDVDAIQRALPTRLRASARPVLVLLQGSQAA